MGASCNDPVEQAGVRFRHATHFHLSIIFFSSCFRCFRPAVVLVQRKVTLWTGGVTARAVDGTACRISRPCTSGRAGSSGKIVVMSEKITKTDDEWRRMLTPDQYEVTRRK